ncbi:hypothetical protein U0026_20035 [Kluyvera intermedia]|uniref:hypothetical protein n=1 Tax=Kluyvera intermedia TaxID=61648 RepID=UPI00078758C6|nr:hypothetical protein [Kluyvera intermedia]WQD29259.1 hypothetical protein U0026_20035 [Kluyvera intermedia]
MKANKIQFFLVAFGVMLLVCAVLYKLFTRAFSPEFSCESFFHQTENGSSYIFDASYSFYFYKDGSGIISADGNVEYNGKKYILRRQASIQFTPVGNGIWKLTAVNETLNASDNTPDEIYSRYFFDRDKQAGRYISIYRINDSHWLIGSLKYPAFLCKSQQ